MRRILILIAAVIAVAGANAQDKELINAAALQSGSYMYSTPNSYAKTNLMSGSITGYAPEALFDLSNKIWCSAKGQAFPHEFVLELTETFLIEKLTFDNHCEKNYAGIHAKEVKVEFSTISPLASYSEVGTYTLNPEEKHEFTFPAREARWIRITILSNHGHKQYTELAEFGAHGTPKNPSIQPIQIDGRWETNWGWVDFSQSRSSVSGNYKYNNGLIKYGGINRNQITYKWEEKVASQEGWVLLFMNAEGTRLTGVWCHNSNWDKYGFWIMDRDKGIPIEPLTEATPEPPAPPKVEVKQEVVKQMETTLKKEGKLTLYGINFNINSAEITADSYVVLDQLAEIIKGNKKLNVRIEGHTDSSGSDTYNQQLSEKRAQAVMQYLIDNHGITSDRLASEGKGEQSPIASNDTEAGKAANRRVEIHQLK